MGVARIGFSYQIQSSPSAWPTSGAPSWRPPGRYWVRPSISDLRAFLMKSDNKNAKSHSPSRQPANGNSNNSITQNSSNFAEINKTGNATTTAALESRISVQSAINNSNSSIDQDSLSSASLAAASKTGQLNVQTADKNIRSRINQSWRFCLDARG